MRTSNRDSPASSRTSRALFCFTLCAFTSLRADTVHAATTLTVDLAQPLGPATHVGSGSLYGVTEKLPADIDKLVAPLHPKVFVNPAADQQQPVGDAIVVAARLAPIGAKVTIRLADWFKGWPYQFTSMSDWFNKLGQTVQRKKSSGLTNFYGYEIWNEPNGTWNSNSPSFNDFWAQTYAELRRLDPDEKIIGPAMAGYSTSFITNFLTYCKDHNVVPDIVAWHELSGEPLAADLQNYRNLEKQLGIGPLPITINEYSGAGWQTDEGKPGTSAPMIAKFERFKVDSACISYWDVAHAGRLGSLLATDTAPNGGWWFYKWYGDMTGNMMMTTAPTPSSATALDGFANLSPSGASVLFGGANDGAIKIVVKGFRSAVVFGDKVHAVVERTPWVDKSTVVNATSMVSAADVTVENDQISVTVSGTNSVDGFRLSLTALGGVPMGAGGANGMGGSAASGGAANAGASSNGGQVGAGGTNGNAGGSNPSPMTGGVASGAGGAVTPGGGAGRSGAATSNGGATSGAGATSGGPASSGAMSSTGSAGTQSPTNGAASANDEAGCACRVVNTPRRDHRPAWLGLLAGTMFLRRRRRPGSAANAKRPGDRSPGLRPIVSRDPRLTGRPVRTTA
jgi:hypothetical protein